MAKERFVKIYTQGTFTVNEIWVDRETGVNYLYHASGNGAGMTPPAGSGRQTGDILVLRVRALVPQTVKSF